MKKILISFMMISSLLLTNAIAAPHGKHGFGSVTGGATPPGLKHKGNPPGLEMQNKSPEGWQHGEKTGWTKSHKIKKPHKSHTIKKIYD